MMPVIRRISELIPYCRVPDVAEANRGQAERTPRVTFKPSQALHCVDDVPHHDVRRLDDSTLCGASGAKIFASEKPRQQAGDFDRRDRRRQRSAPFNRRTFTPSK